MKFLRRLLKSDEDITDASSIEDTLVGEPRAVPPSAAWDQVGWATDVGQVRTHNEDALLVVGAYQEGGEVLSPFRLSILADGMGGHRSGEVASALAARTVARHITQQVYLHVLSDEEHSSSQPPLSEILIEAFNSANAVVAQTVPGGGTTLTVALMIGQRAHIAHVGDSRAYLVSAQGLRQVTRDHSLVDRLVEMGQLTVDEAATHPQKNVLYRAIGQSGVLDVDTYLVSVPAGEHLLLCSDGLWGMLSDEDMANIVTESQSNQIACDNLVAAANEAGGKDNITVILIDPPPEE
jgi:protein phosphatase